MPSHHRSRRHQRLAELLAAYRAKANLYQADVAKKLERHQPFMTSIENGQRRIDVIELLDLAEVIGFDPHELLDELMRTPKD
ncbi:helix-turn-helix domain-containing protein [Microvirga pudoricolor]|uniref:helix-turn-helix domain-containing protein n=1 Tax=Microvirga pudoricolor TaxID=2778729 RepID=UPI0019508B01|nr:helix-turn-helix transcriptional regulator [Microvirga pudoricolor]MBM6595332.1 helix-turn-helix transcriptional regulator [Microvirga pudoricolor]